MSGPPLVVCPVRRGGQVGPVAPWITMAGWTQAAAARHGEAWLLTTEGALDARDARQRATTPTPTRGAATSASSWRRRIPEPLVTLAKDVRRIGQNRAFDRALDRSRWRGRSVPYVFQLHGLFWDAGLRLARDLRAPSVLVVDACQVEEARSWGVHRPGWSHVAERRGEAPALRRADLVVCVSDEVAASVARVAGRRDGVIVVPNGVDTELFSATADDGDAALDALGPQPGFVVGWAGSFRTFHGLELLVDAAARLRDRIPDLTLLLVGDGLGRPALKDAARAANVHAVFPGTVAYTDVPRYLRAMDVAVALAPSADFHYSPVKLREYQACGVPVIAAAAGEMSRLGADGDTARLVPPGDPGALARAIESLHRDRDAARAMGARGRDLVVETASWDQRLSVVEAALALR
jgi:glycosyltransferase involved in cell wall biosynthesis